ncbi:MAG: helix-turn-helix transcriptional regulator [Firmicutes bacterium]|nr:helix-turn-helix transcriptional regulator [Bacillota bacterium]
MYWNERLKEIRENLGITQAAVAEVLGTTAQYYGRYEKGECELPFSRAIRLAKFFRVSLDDIAGLRENVDMNALNSEEIELLAQYNKLTDKNKGKAELYIELTLRQQKGN